MRQIVLDTETTGLEVALGHRIIELAGVEIINRRPSGRRFHRYLNPEREIDAGAIQVHGLQLEFLQDKPKFADVVDQFLEFIDGAELIIHNAAFDVAFLDRELALLERPRVAQSCSSVVDTLRMARDFHPGKRNSLDALCERYRVDNSARSLHGALLDAALLTEVYLAMTRGQEALMIDLALPEQRIEDTEDWSDCAELVVIIATAQEVAAHQRQLEGIDKASKGECLWWQLLMEPVSEPLPVA